MDFIRQILETRLATALGLPVTMAKFSAAPLSGRVEIGDLAVGELIRVKKIVAKISLAGLLKRQVIIQSLTIHAPVVTITGPLPNPPPTPPAKPPDRAPKAGPPGDGGWKAEVHDASLDGGQIVIQPPGAGGYTLSIDEVTATVRFANGAHAVEIAAAAVGRTDQVVELGAATLTARLAGEAIDAQLRVGEGIEARGQSASLRGGPWAGSIEITLAAAKLLDLIPPTIKLPIHQASGIATLMAAASVDASKRVTIERFTLSTRDVIIN